MLKNILGNHVFYDKIGRCPTFEGEDRQLNIEWLATLGADMKIYPVNYHLRCWAYILHMEFDAFVMKIGLDGGGNLGVGAQCTMISLIASSFQDQPYHRISRLVKPSFEDYPYHINDFMR